MNLNASIEMFGGGPGSGRKPSKSIPIKPFSDMSKKEKTLVRSNPKQTSLYGPGHTKELSKLKSAEESVEMESRPIRPIPGKKRIVKQGTQFCVESDGVDKNFGCYPDKQQARDVAQGKSFIEHNMNFAKWKHPTAHGKYGDITHYAYKQIRWSVDPDTGEVIAPEDPKMEEERKVWRDRVKKLSKTFVGGIAAASNMPMTGWQYGKRTLPVGYIPTKTLSGFPSGKGGGRGGLPQTPHHGTPSPKPKPAGHHMTNPSMHKGTGVKHKFANPSMHKGIGVGHRMPNHSFKAPKAPKMPTMPYFKGLRAGGPGSGRHKSPKALLKEHDSFINHDMRYNSENNLRHDGVLYQWQKEKISSLLDNVRLTVNKTTGGSQRSELLSKVKRAEEHLTDAHNSAFKQDYLSATNSQESAIMRLHQAINSMLKEDLAAYADYGEPMAGALQHAHLDTNLWFHPPSLKNADKIPTDDPKEKDNKFMDVTKRKEAHKDRMKLLKRSSPGGLPALIPAHTTLLSPHQAAYTPGMFSAALGRARRRSGGGMFRALGAAKI